jgi:hypothetical protein
MMSIHHLKANLQEQSRDGYFIYVYYPEFVEAETASGVFSVKPGEWSPKILVPAGAEEMGLLWTDEFSVGWIVCYLRQEFEATGKMPAEKVIVC